MPTPELMTDYIINHVFNWSRQRKEKKEGQRMLNTSGSLGGRDSGTTILGADVERRGSWKGRRGLSRLTRVSLRHESLNARTLNNLGSDSDHSDQKNSSL